MIVLITGDRDWRNFLIMANWISALSEKYPELTIIHGDCKGADKMSESIAKMLHIPYRAFSADWNKYGKKAGPLRNQKMLDDNPDIARVYAFHDHIEQSKGTKDMILRAYEKGIPILLITSIGNVWKIKNAKRVSEAHIEIELQENLESL